MVTKNDFGCHPKIWPSWMVTEAHFLSQYVKLHFFKNFQQFAIFLITNNCIFLSLANKLSITFNHQESCSLKVFQKHIT